MSTTIVNTVNTVNTDANKFSININLTDEELRATSSVQRSQLRRKA